jgi:hypothetical protein
VENRLGNMLGTSHDLRRGPPFKYCWARSNSSQGLELDLAHRCETKARARLGLGIAAAYTGQDTIDL